MSDTPRTNSAIFEEDTGYNGLVQTVSPDFARELERENVKLRGKVFALEKAGDAMDLLLTGSMKPSKGVRDAWANAKKL